MRKYVMAFSAVLLGLSGPANAGLFDGAGALVKQMKLYIGRPAQELVDALGDATDQKQVLDNIVITGGFDSDDGPSCTWKIIADKDKIVKDVSVFGNPFGCGPMAKSLKKYIKDHPIGQ